jgi:hypothetical protein
MLLYVIEDNYEPGRASLADSRALIGDTGSLLTGLIASTRRRLAGKVAGTTVLAALIAWWTCRLLIS